MLRSSIHRAILLAWLLVAVLPAASCLAGVPVLYSTDLYHPHDDPDDHYDLATLFALRELDVKGIIIDMSNMGQLRSYQQAGKRPGLVAVQQLVHLTGRKVPVAVGLDQPLSSPDDRALQQSDQSQAAVRLILSTLAAADEKVCIFTVGSLRDVAVAYNRDPELMRAKVRAIYVNAGTGPGGYQTEWNVLLDPLAYRRVLLSDLPIYWYPCFGEDRYRTYFRVDQTEVVGSCPPALQAYFHYALTRSQEDPIAYLARSCPAPTGPRNMWCTPSFIDLAGRRIYRTSRGFEALAAPPGPDAKPVNCYQMLPVRLSLAAQPASPRTIDAPPPHAPYLQADLQCQESNVHVIRNGDPAYSQVMASCLKNILASFPATATERDVP